jgi:hypothetical protein
MSDSTKQPTPSESDRETARLAVATVLRMEEAAWEPVTELIATHTAARVAEACADKDIRIEIVEDALRSANSRADTLEKALAAIDAKIPKNWNGAGDRKVYHEPSPEDPVGGYTDPYFDEIVDDISNIIEETRAASPKEPPK